jgi:hypothetical protein
MAQQISDRLDRLVHGHAVARRLLNREVALLRKDGGDSIAPGRLHRGEDSGLVVNEHVMTSRIAALDVLQLLFLVDVNENFTRERLPQA